MFGLGKKSKPQDNIMDVAAQVLSLQFKMGGFSTSLSKDAQAEILGDLWTLGYFFGFAEFQLQVLQIRDYEREGSGLIRLFFQRLLGNPVGDGLFEYASSSASTHPPNRIFHEGRMAGGNEAHAFATRKSAPTGLSRRMLERGSSATA